VHPVTALTRLGGVGDRALLLRATTRRRLRTSLGRGEIVRVSRGTYALPTAHDALVAAGRLSAAASHASAASIHGWELAQQPDRPQLVVPRNREVPPHRRSGVDLRWRPVTPDEIRAKVTDMHQTVIDCAKDLPLADALAIADSALRHRDVDHDRLVAMALALPTNGRTRALRVVEHASPLAANPFESVLRAISLDVPGINLQPQVIINERGFYGRPDLVDSRRRLVVEAESWRFHSGKTAFARDCERYTGLAIRGWTVLRFTWRNVFHRPDYVRDALTYWAQGPDAGATLPPTLLYSA